MNEPCSFEAPNQAECLASLVLGDASHFTEQRLGAWCIGRGFYGRGKPRCFSPKQREVFACTHR